MMKYLTITFFVAIGLYVTSCNNELEISNPEVIPIDTVGFISENDYYLTITIGDTSMSFKTKSNKVGNGVLSSVIGPCFIPGRDSVKYASYFSYVADTNHNEIVSFGLMNCVAPGANGYRDSTYIVGKYPIENSYLDTIPVDTARGFIDYVDAKGVLWSTSLSLNGDGAQKKYAFELTKVTSNYSTSSVFDIEGKVTGWVYNGLGDSMLVSASKFKSKAWALQ